VVKGPPNRLRAWRNPNFAFKARGLPCPSIGNRGIGSLGQNKPAAAEALGSERGWG